MTHEQWIALSPEEQRAKVGELCGHQEPVPVGGLNDPDEQEWEDILGHPVPDYCYDLNAMHEAEKEPLSRKDLHLMYVSNLISVCGSDGWRFDPAALIHATAAQRAEAFVLTMEPS